MARFIGYLSKKEADAGNSIHAKLEGQDLGVFVSIHYSARLRRDVIRIMLNEGREHPNRNLRLLDVWWDDNGMLAEDSNGLTTQI